MNSSPEFMVFYQWECGNELRTLVRMRVGLTARLNTDIPKCRDLCRSQVKTILADRKSSSSEALRPIYDEELRRVASFLCALDKHEEKCKAVALSVDNLTRRLCSGYVPGARRERVPESLCQKIQEAENKTAEVLNVGLDDGITEKENVDEKALKRKLAEIDPPADSRSASPEILPSQPWGLRVPYVIVVPMFWPMR